MKNPLVVIALVVFAAFCALMILGDSEPTTGRYPEARKVVNSVRIEVQDFYSQHNALPKDLSFVTDQDLKNKIRRYNITFDPVAKEIESRDNITYYPDKLHRFTLGILGDPKGLSVGEPGYTFEYQIPGKVAISE